MDLNLKMECQTSRNVKRMSSKNSKGAQLMVTDTVQMFSMYKSRNVSEKLREMHFMCLLHLFYFLLQKNLKEKQHSGHGYNAGTGIHTKYFLNVSSLLRQT